jgi:hypothetical protein
VTVYKFKKNYNLVRKEKQCARFIHIRMCEVASKVHRGTHLMYFHFTVS